MTLPTNLSAYLDVEKVLNSALTAGGGDITFASKAAATRWRLRAHNFRALYRKGNDGKSPWDVFVLRLKDNTVSITPRGEIFDEAQIVETSFPVTDAPLDDDEASLLADLQKDLFTSTEPKND